MGSSGGYELPSVVILPSVRVANQSLEYRDQQTGDRGVSEFTLLEGKSWSVRLTWQRFSPKCHLLRSPIPPRPCKWILSNRQWNILKTRFEASFLAVVFIFTFHLQSTVQPDANEKRDATWGFIVRSVKSWEKSCVVCLHVFKYASMSMFMYTCICVYVCLCIPEWLYLCLYIPLCMYLYMHDCIIMYTCTSVSCVYVRICTPVSKYMFIYTYIYMYT